MIKILSGKKINLSAMLLITSFLLLPSHVFAGWYFNWSCWKSSGREGPYATRSACESDLNRARNACGSKFSSMGCSGFDDRPPQQNVRTPPPQPRVNTPPRQPLHTPPPNDDWKREIYHPTQDQEQKLREAAEEQNRREQEAARKFEEEKEKTLKELKGGSSETLKIKGGTEILGLKGSPDVELKRAGAEKPAITSAWKQLHCSAYISGFAFKAAAKKGSDKNPDWDEVRYLAGEANKALSGDPVGVQCPETPAPPKPYGQAELGNNSTVVKFYRILLRATQEQSDRANQAEKKIREATYKKQDARVEVEKKEKEVAKLKEEIQSTAAKTENELKEKDTQVDDKKRRALEEAKRALEDSIKAREKVDKLSDEAITSATKEKAEAQALLGQFEKLFNQVQADPNKASEFLKMIQK